MKIVKLKKDFPDIISEIEVPEGVFKEEVTDYQDTKPYYKYFYINKKGNKKECEVKYI